MTVQPTRDQLRALADAATPGPWTPCTEGWATISSSSDSVIHAYHPRDCCHECGEPYDMEPGVAIGVEDLEFIAAARTAVPQLLDQLDAAEQRIRDLTQEVKDERGAALDQMEQVRIRDARIRAVEDVLDTWMTYCQTEQTARALSDIRRALEG